MCEGDVQGDVDGWGEGGLGAMVEGEGGCVSIVEVESERGGRITNGCSFRHMSTSCCKHSRHESSYKMLKIIFKN